MRREPGIAGFGIHSIAVSLVCAALMSTAARGEQTDVKRYDGYIGYSYFNSPRINLTEHGTHIQLGVRPSKHYSIGFDYSTVSGELTLAPDLLVASLQEQLRGQLARLAAAGLLPSGYVLTVPTHSRTSTFTVGPQLAIRRWVPVTPFIRPSCGLIREIAEPRPGDQISRAVIAQLAPDGVKKDWTPFYGVGGGVDLNITPNFALRVQADYVWDHLFPDIIREGRRTVRFSIGSAFNFGRNIIRH